MDNKKKGDRVFIAAILAISVFTVFAAPVSADIIYVPSPGNETIQQAINNASDGDTVFVWNGTYFENVILNKSITLQGEGKDVVTIDGRGNTCINVIAARTTIDGFNVTNATNADNYGILVSGVDTCNITNNKITNNNGGIYAYSSNNINIANNNITSNLNDGISRIEDCDTVLLSGNQVYNNSRRGITNITNAINVTIINNNISYNGWGGGDNPDGIYNITYINGSVTITGNTIFNNSQDGIDWITNNAATVTISGNTIYNNGDEGIDDIEYINGSVTITGNTISHNDWDGIDDIEDINGSVTVTDNTITYNGDEGIEDIEYINGSVTVTDNVVSYNWDEGFEDIGKINGSVTITGNTITYNGHDGLYGGSSAGIGSLTTTGITMSEDEEDDLEESNNDKKGEDVKVSVATMGITLSSIEEGGIEVEDDEGSSDEGIGDIEDIEGDVVISNNVISNNDEEGIDDIWWINGSVTITGNTISNNGDEGIERIEEINGSVTVTGNTIVNNSGYGIGIFTDNATISNNEITENTHGLWVNSSYNTIVRNMIARNSEADTGVHLTEYAKYNEIHENCFFDNVPQAMDNGIGNNWNRNYWSPPPGGPDNYTIPGTAGSKDHNPLSSCPLIAAKVPSLTPIGLIALAGLLSVIAAVSIRTTVSKKRE